MSRTPAAIWIDHIPAIYLEPRIPQPTRRLVIFLDGLSGRKENLLPYLSDLSDAGFVALSFDAYEHGERTAMTQGEIIERTFGNFRRYMWPIIGQTVLDSLRVIDWAINNLGVDQQVYMGGISMGGDISITAAGIDHRIRRAGALVATPDWLRPGMTDLRKEGHPILPPGTPDAYARHFYEQYNPITHLSHYSRAPQIHFINAEKDDHVPPEAAFRFKSALAELYPQAADAVTIDLLPGRDHATAGGAKDQWWPALIEWFNKSEL